MRNRATAIGFIAILLWSFLALFTVGSTPVPPFQLTSMAFSLATLLGIAWTASNRGFGALGRISWRVYAFGTAGLFGYHFLYFSALRMAPPAEAGLIAYLWPLLIVLLSGLLPGERLRAGHLLGAAAGFAGAAIIASGGVSGFSVENVPGYLLAAGCALTWSSYSVISRRLGNVPTESVTIFCLGTAVLSFVAHLLMEKTAWPVGAVGWGSVALLGLGPVGLAFYLWDYGVKRGNIQMLGVASYAAPLLSTLALVAAGVAAATWQLFGAAILITAGAIIAARASINGSRSQA